MKKQILFTESNQVSNYYHIIVDFLPIIYQEYLLNTNVIINFDYPSRTSLIKQIIEAIFGNTIKIDTNLVTPTKYSYNAIKNSINYAYIQYLKSMASKKIQKIQTYEKILIHRRNRYIDNNLIEYLKSIGFVEIQCENLSISEQCHIFGNANIIIGSHGAGLTNILFCKQTALIIELNNGFNPLCYPNIAKLCNLSLYTLFDQNIITSTDNPHLCFGDIKWQTPYISNSHIIKANTFNMPLPIFINYMSYIINYHEAKNTK